MNAPIVAPYDVEAIRARVSDPVAAGLRQAAGLSRQRRLGAEAARRHRRHGRTSWRPATPTFIAACTSWPTRRRNRSRARARPCGSFSTPVRSTRSCSPSRRPRPTTWWRTSFGRMAIGEGDEIILSIMEHHSNIVPWHFLRERKGAVIKWAPVDDEGNFLLDEFEKLFTPRTKIVAITHMSNVLGTVTPIKRDHPHRPRAWRAGAGRWRAGGGPSRRRRARPRCRFLRVHRPQGLRPDRDRRSLRQERVARSRCRPIRAAAR